MIVNEKNIFMDSIIGIGLILVLGSAIIYSITDNYIFTLILTGVGLFLMFRGHKLQQESDSKHEALKDYRDKEKDED